MEAIIGIGVGAAVLVITIVVVAVAILCCRNKDDGSFIRVDGRGGSATTNVWFFRLNIVAAAWMTDFASIKSSFSSIVTSLVDQAYTNFSQYPDLKFSRFKYKF